jgi:hypothetical protein
MAVYDGGRRSAQICRGWLRIRRSQVRVLPSALPLTWDSTYVRTSASDSLGCDVRVYSLGGVRFREGQKEEV